MTTASIYASKAPSRRKEKTILGWLTSGKKGGPTQDFESSLGKAFKIGSPLAYDEYVTTNKINGSVGMVGHVLYRQHSAAIGSVRIVAAEDNGDFTLSYACAWEMLNKCGVVQVPINEEEPIEVPVQVPVPPAPPAPPVPAPVPGRRVRAREGPAEDDMIAAPYL